MRRIVLFTVLVLAVLTPLVGAAQAGATGGPIVFGAAQPADGGLSAQNSVLALESSIGRKLSAVRLYDKWNTPFPNSYTDWLKNNGRTVFLSVKPRTMSGTIISWASIATAKPGDPVYDDMVKWASNIKAFGNNMYFTFNHEPDIQSSQVYGTPSEYIAAWDNFISVLRASGVTNAEYVWTVAESDFLWVSPTDKRYAPKFYPGDPYVDDIAVDAYNMYCLRTDGKYQRPWEPMSYILAPLMTFAGAHPDQGLMLAEWGTPEDAAVAGRKAQWITETENLLQSPGYERFKAVLYWNQKSSNFANCDFRVNTSGSSLTAFAAMANDPYYTAPAP